MATLGLGVPVAGFFTAHISYAFCYGLQTVEALERLDSAKEQFCMSAERRRQLQRGRGGPLSAA
jgi:hypothetical protein